jgi:hypothetical protein
MFSRSARGDTYLFQMFCTRPLELSMKLEPVKIILKYDIINQTRNIHIEVAMIPLNILVTTNYNTDSLKIDRRYTGKLFTFYFLLKKVIVIYLLAICDKIYVPKTYSKYFLYLICHVDGHGLAALYEGCDDSLEPVRRLVDLEAQAPVLRVLRLPGQRHQ